MPYISPSGTETLFAAEGTDFFDVTSAGAVGSAVVSSLTNARWDSINYTNTSGTSFLCCFNATDNPQYWDNSSWTAITGVSSPAITGVTTSTLKAPWVHQRRMWLIEKNTLFAWYLPVDAVGGAARKLDLSGMCRRGGSLVAGGSYTFDAGSGPDDYWYAITSEGEVIAFRGTDPVSESTWTIVGVWHVGEPIGTKPLLRFRGEALLILREGVYPLSQALITATTDKSVAITNRIKEKFADAAALHNSKFGWELVFYPEVNMLIVNVPVAEGSIQEQFCMNTITGAWTNFQGLEANCWAIFKGQPYFGSNTLVAKFWGVFADNSTNIDTQLQQAFSNLGAPGRLKNVNLIKPYLFSNGSPEVLVDVNMDFRDVAPSGALTFSAPAFAVWDTDKWDEANWGGDLEVNDNWQTVFGVGDYAALRMQTASSGIEIRLGATGFVYEYGGIVG